MSEEFYSKWINLGEFDFSSNYLNGTTELTEIDFTIWYDGKVYFDCSLYCQNYELPLTIDEISEIARIAKLYRDRRYNYLQKMNK